MDLLNIAFDTSRGIGDAYFNRRLREGNRDANLGMNYFFSCITQYCLLENTFSKDLFEYFLSNKFSIYIHSREYNFFKKIH